MATGPAAVSAAPKADEAQWVTLTAAQTICIMCIGIGTWLVYQSDPRDVVLHSPVERVELVSAGPLDETAAPALDTSLGGARETLVRQFQRPNAMDREMSGVRRPDEVYVRRDPIDAGAIELPPLLLPQPGAAVVAAAPEPTIEVMDLPAEPPVALASVAGLPVEASAPDAPAVVASEPTGVAHRVARGERLVQISERYYGSRDARYVDALLAANPKVRAREGRVLAGETLRVPAMADKHGALPAVPLTALKSATNSKDADAKVATAEPRWYTIQAKDSLSGIAERFLSDSKRWPDIVKLNRKLDPNKIVPGMRIKLPPVIGVASH